MTSLAAGYVGQTPYLAVGLSDTGVQIYNVSDPSSPQLTGTFGGTATGDDSDLDGDQARSRSASDDEVDSVMNGASSHASEPEPVEQAPTHPVSDQQNVLQDVVGSEEVSDTDKSILEETPAITTSVNTNEAADELVSGPFRSGVRPDPGVLFGNSPVQTAMNGNWSEEADVFGIGRHATELTADLDIDDFVEYLRIYRSSPGWDDD